MSSYEEFAELPETLERGGKVKEQVSEALKQAPMTQKQLAETVGRKEQYINRIVHDLMKDGLVIARRTIGAKNRPVTIYGLKELVEHQ